MTQKVFSLAAFCRNIVYIPLFEKLILGVIVFNAVVIGLETSAYMVDHFGHYLKMFDRIILGIFVVEACLKITAEAPRIDRYFRQGWNVFDFTVVVLSFLPTGEFATAARLVRVLRVARLITVVPELRLIISTLLRSLPGMGHIVMLLGVFFYIYGIMGYHLFHKTLPEQWGSLGSSLLTLFGVVTLEGWVETMSGLLPAHPYAWMYFLTFIVMGTFTFVNLFVAVVINNLSEAKAERIKELELPATKEDILKELRQTKEALVRLEEKFNKE